MTSFFCIPPKFIVLVGDASEEDHLVLEDPVRYAFATFAKPKVLWLERRPLEILNGFPRAGFAQEELLPRDRPHRSLRD